MSSASMPGPCSPVFRFSSKVEKSVGFTFYLVREKEWNPQSQHSIWQNDEANLSIENEIKKRWRAWCFKTSYLFWIDIRWRYKKCGYFVELMFVGLGNKRQWVLKQDYCFCSKKFKVSVDRASMCSAKECPFLLNRDSRISRLPWRQPSSECRCTDHHWVGASVRIRA